MSGDKRVSNIKRDGEAPDSIALVGAFMADWRVLACDVHKPGRPATAMALGMALQRSGLCQARFGLPPCRAGILGCKRQSTTGSSPEQFGIGSAFHCLRRGFSGEVPATLVFWKDPLTL